MNKMVGWALAFAAVMSVPASAMALRGDRPHEAYIVNGAQVVPVGIWRFTLDQLVFSDWDEACSFFVKWVNGPAAAGGAPFLPVTSANLFAEEVATAGTEDCDENSYYPQPTFLRLSTVLYPNVSKGFDKFQQKRAVCNIMLGEDPLTGCFSGIIQFHPASVPFGFKLNPIP